MLKSMFNLPKISGKNPSEIKKEFHGVKENKMKNKRLGIFLLAIGMVLIALLPEPAMADEIVCEYSEVTSFRSTRHQWLGPIDNDQRNPQKFVDLTNTFNKTNRVWDSLNVKFIGNWPFGFSHVVTTNYEESNGKVYLGSGGGVYIIQTTGYCPDLGIQKISELIHTRGYVEGLFYKKTGQNERLYIAAGDGGFEIWDVSDPSMPLKLGYYETPGYAMEVTVINSFAYIADGDAGIRVIDISDPSNPTEVGFYDADDIYANAVAIQNSFVYVADGYGRLRVIDISDPSNPTQVGFCDTPPAYGPFDIDIQDSYAYLANGEAGLVIIDISNPSYPYVIGDCDDAEFALGVEVVSGYHGTYAYVAAAWDRTQVVDISDPSNPYVLMHWWYYSGQDRGIAMIPGGDYRAYMASLFAGLWVVRIWAPGLEPIYECANFGVPGYAVDVALAGSYAYTVDLWNNKFHVIDISDLSNPTEVGVCGTGYDAFRLAVQGSYAYVAVCAGIGYGGLKVIDISDPSNPMVVGSYSGGDGCYAVAVQGSYAYISTINGGFTVIDISDPSNPTEIGQCGICYNSYDIAVQDSYAYVADGGAGLRVIDISDPSNPNEIGYYDTYGKARGIAVHDTYAYIADEGDGLRIIDISDPLNPTEVGYYDTPGSALGVAVQDSYAYVANCHDGLRVIDISDPSNPTETGFYDTPDRAWNVAVQGSYAYIVDDQLGLQIYENLSIENVGDFNNDGYVDAADLQLLGDHWHFVSTDPGWDALYDLVPDNIIDAADLQVFGDHWHEGTPPPKSGEGGKDGKGPNEFAGIVFDLDATTTGNQNLTSIPSQPIGTMIRLDVYCTGVNNLDTYEFEVIYDATELAYISSSATNPITYEGNILESLGGTALGWMVDSSTPGVLSIAYTLAGNDPAQAPEGEGLVADIVFQALVAPHGTLSFGDVYYYDSYGVVDLITDTGTATLPVELSSFNAIYNTVSGFVSLCWATSSETDVNGFNIYRNTEDSFVEAVKINVDLIAGAGTTTEPTEYSFKDETADPYYTTYYYWLEVINFGGTNDKFGHYQYIPIDVNNNGELDIITSALGPCYPNPSRIGNEIKFNFRVGGLEGTAHNVELKVYNILGKLVAEVVNGERLVNDYTETWNPENLSNGVYFYELKTENYSEVKKMVIQ